MSLAVVPNTPLSRLPIWQQHIVALYLAGAQNIEERARVSAYHVNWALIAWRREVNREAQT